MTEVVDYISGICRNDQDKVRSHTYAVMSDGEYIPMCGYGWNRSDGHAFSIFRGHISSRGHCKICDRRVQLRLPPVAEGWDHPTKWL